MDRKVTKTGNITLQRSARTTRCSAWSHAAGMQSVCNFDQVLATVPSQHSRKGIENTSVVLLCSTVSEVLSSELKNHFSLYRNSYMPRLPPPIRSRSLKRIADRPARLLASIGDHGACPPSEMLEWRRLAIQIVCRGHSRPLRRPSNRKRVAGRGGLESAATNAWTQRRLRALGRTASARRLHSPLGPATQTSEFTAML
ncbi:jg1489 [Pararge aegeria aegeria]|uniref:Jg1489 protein n=1 Tax=Pararge aegeria aegeria TaxID=348720 RepID=A0A8S4QYR4_9NEOP|nr:jg1489 [Pararge aegeria aegeria]